MNMNDHFENLTKRPLIVRFFRWLFSWRIIRRMLVALAGLITLLALFITEENWRGKRAWENYKRAAEARGETVRPKTQLAAAVPRMRELKFIFIKSFWRLNAGISCRLLPSYTSGFPSPASRAGWPARACGSTASATGRS